MSSANINILIIGGGALMAYTALYREWRPRTFGDVVGQKHITTTLKNGIKNNRIAHAYLLCGTRGTGKTSTAKIFSKAVNCLNPQDGEPCNECEMCKKIDAGIAIDVVEIDAASHNGVDNIREIIDEVQYPPRESKYKVYVIDEVHMLSTGAVNAFLKTLEEPPSRTIFVLATTDPQKLPITILSRCQRFDFRRIKSEDIFERLRRIVTEQGVYADDESLKLIARMSDGAMRDALSVLDQAISMGGGKVEYELILGMLGVVNIENLLKITDCIIEKNVETSIKALDEIAQSGKDIYNFIKDLITHMRNLMMVKITQKPEEVLDMSAENIEQLKNQAQKIRVEEIMRIIRILQETEEQSKWSKQSRIYLELALIKMCKIEYDTSKEVLLARINKMEEAIRRGEITVTREPASVPVPTSDRQKAAPTVRKAALANAAEEPLNYEASEAGPSKFTIDDVKKAWRDILETFKAKRLMVIYASLITGEVAGFSKGLVHIRFGPEYAFNKQRLERPENKTAVDETFSAILKEKVIVRYEVDRAQEQAKDNSELLKEAFGEELVEIIDE